MVAACAVRVPLFSFEAFGPMLHFIMDGRGEAWDQPVIIEAVSEIGVRG